MHTPPVPAAPHERQAPPSAPEDASLVLQRFMEVPWIKFGTVPPRTAATASLHVENPSKTAAHLTLDKFPTIKGAPATAAAAPPLPLSPPNETRCARPLRRQQHEGFLGEAGG